MKVTFITHYFPPLNSSGARRVNAFARYLSSWGHEVTVITTRKSTADGILSEEVPSYLHLLEIDYLGRVRSTPIDESEGGEGVHTRSFLGRILLRIKRTVMASTGQLLDHRLLFALQFAAPWLAKEVKVKLQNTDIIVTSCPPWITHLAGRLVKSRYNKPWIADYRDQFSGSHILRGSALSRSIEVALDKWLIRSSDLVVAISSPMQEYYAQYHPRVTCVENGYDANIFDQLRPSLQNAIAPKCSEEIVLRYLGTITRDRIPSAFLQALVQVNRTPGPRMVAEFYGETSLLRDLVPQLMPAALPLVKFCSQLSYADAIRSMMSASALFFVETSDFSSHSARGVLTTKLFEYLAAKRPVIAEIDPRSLAANFITRSGLGLVVSEDSAEIYEGLLKLRERKVHQSPNDVFIDSLSREVKTREFERLLFSLNDQYRSNNQ